MLCSLFHGPDLCAQPAADRRDTVHNPGEMRIWFFYVPGTPRIEDVRTRLLLLAADKGYRVLEYDLTDKSYFRNLVELHSARELHWMGDVELFVGGRHLAGARTILDFLDGWEAGTEELWPRLRVSEDSAQPQDPGEDRAPEAATAETPGPDLAPDILVYHEPERAPRARGIFGRYWHTVLVTAVLAAILLVYSVRRAVTRGRS